MLTLIGFMQRTVRNARGAKNARSGVLRTRTTAVVHHGTAFLAVLLFLLLPPSVSGFSGDRLPQLPEHREVRQRNRHLIFAPVGELPALEARVVAQRSSPQRVRIQAETQHGYVYLLFVNEVAGTFPIYSAGTMIVRRSLEDGSFSQVKVFLRNDERFYVRLRPDDDAERVLMSVYAMDRPVNEDVVLPFSLDAVLEGEFSLVLQASRGVVRWQELIAPVASEPGYRAVREVADKVRSELPNLPDAEDGAMDENGRLVFIESLRLQNGLPGFNCSGFAKWVSDGFYYPLAGRYMAIEELKVKHVEARGHRFSRPLEDERDPYFGLDWSRNIATTVSAVQVPSSAARSVEDADVRNVPGFRYLEDVGFPTEDIPVVLYRLEIREPGMIYIGSVNDEFGAGPTMRQHFHIVVFFPYFDEEGRFYVDVMERNVETSIDSRQRRYSGDFIHLVRIRADGPFTAPTIEVLNVE